MKRSPLPQGRHHIWIYHSDWRWLCEKTKSGPLANFYPGSLAREIIHTFVKRRLELELNEAGDPDPLQVEMDL